MKTIHIIPSAFEYFEDIKELSFAIVEKLCSFDIECQVRTLQYTTPTKKQKKTISGDPKTGLGGVAPSYEYVQTGNLDEMIAGFNKYDLVHLHCPFLGAAGKFLAWARQSSRPPLVITYYRPVLITDLFAWLISIYNSYYMPRLAKESAIISYVSLFSQKKPSYILTDQAIDIVGRGTSDNILDVSTLNALKLDMIPAYIIDIDTIINIYSKLTNKSWVKSKKKAKTR